MDIPAIRDLLSQSQGQGTYEEYALVYEVLARRAPCALLIFGVGRDSPLWINANAGGRTVFLESVAKWATFARSATPGIDVRDIGYGPWRRFMWPLLRRTPRLLELSGLPADIRDTVWDVILVDAPRGTTWRRPGRMRSVCTAAARAAPGADVFVHDCHRTVERESADQFLGAHNLVAEAGTMRHYRPR